MDSEHKDLTGGLLVRLQGRRYGGRHPSPGLWWAVGEVTVVACVRVPTTLAAAHGAWSKQSCRPIAITLLRSEGGRQGCCRDGMGSIGALPVRRNLITCNLRRVRWRVDGIGRRYTLNYVETFSTFFVCGCSCDANVKFCNPNRILILHPQFFHLKASQVW